METISFDKLLIKTAFCCMASDGKIDHREIRIIQTLCVNNSLFKEFDFQEEINRLIQRINEDSSEFINYYFKLLSDSKLSESEELTLIDFAVKTIKADDEVTYSEIKFFKNIRHRLKIEKSRILEFYPDIEDFLEEDIHINSNIEDITSQFFNSVQISDFKFVDLNSNDLFN